MKQLLFLLIVTLFAVSVYGQDVTVTPPPFTSVLSVQARSIPLIQTGVQYHIFDWNTTGTVNTGACALQKSADNSSWSILIAAQTVTSTGIVASLATERVNYVRLNCTTPITGSGQVTITYRGYLYKPLFVLGNVTVTGDKSNNGGTAGSTNVGTLGAVATAAQPTYTEGNQVANSTDLRGRQRNILCDAALNDRCANVDANNYLQVVSPGITYNVTPSTLGGGTQGDFQITADQRLLTAPYALASVMGTAPTAATAGTSARLLSTRTGVPFNLGGSPDIVTIRTNFTTSQDDTAIVTVGSGSKIIVTQMQLICSAAVSVSVSFIAGFGAANTPTTTGVVVADPGTQGSSHSGVSRGVGSGVLGTGADGEDLRFDASVPTGGSCDIVTSYFTVAS